jgi:hypothetical protein
VGGAAGAPGLRTHRPRVGLRTDRRPPSHPTNSDFMAGTVAAPWDGVSQTR